MRRLLLSLALLACPAFPACSGSEDAATPPADAALDDSAVEDDASKPPIDPKLFDCSSLAKGPPARRSSVPEACLRDPKCKTRLVTGHRGAGGDLGRIAPEDTLSAIRAAVVMGVDFVETDPRPTKDGVLVNFHDVGVERTTLGTGNVPDLTLAEVQALRLKTDLPGDWSCEKVPTFVDILKLARGRAMVLVDANKTDRVDLLVKAIHDADALEWAIFDTSGLDKIDAALALEPKLMIMPRIGSEAQADAILARWPTHTPVLVEVDAALFPKTADKIHAAGSRVFTDVFLTDVGVKLGQPVTRYLPFYEQGADVLQSDLPDLVLEAIGRPYTP